MFSKARILLIVTTCLITPLSVRAQTRSKSASGRVEALVNNECPIPTIPANAELRKLVTQVMRHEGLGLWGDRAWPYDLNGDSRPEYLVMLDCSAVGNCNWGVFAVRPVRFLGIISGKDLIFRKRSGPWAALTTYGHVTASEGVLTTFCFRRGRYVKCGRESEVSASKKNLPKFLSQKPINCSK